MTKTSRQKFKYLDNRKSFQSEIKKHFSSSLKDSVAKNFFGPENLLLILIKYISHVHSVISIKSISSFYKIFLHKIINWILISAEKNVYASKWLDVSILKIHGIVLIILEVIDMLP